MIVLTPLREAANFGAIYRSRVYGRSTTRRAGSRWTASRRKWSQPRRVSDPRPSPAESYKMRKAAAEAKAKAVRDRRRRIQEHQKYIAPYRTPANKFEREARSRMTYYKAKKKKQDDRKRFSRVFRTTTRSRYPEYAKYMSLVVRTRNRDITQHPAFKRWAAGGDMEDFMAAMKSEYESLIKTYKAKKAAKYASWDAEDALYDQQRAAEAKVKLTARQQAKLNRSIRRQAARDKAIMKTNARAEAAKAGTFPSGEYPSAARSGVNPPVMEAVKVYVQVYKVSPGPVAPELYERLVSGIRSRARKTARNKRHYYVYAGKRQAFPVTQRAIIYYLEKAGYTKAQPMPQFQIPEATPTPSQSRPAEVPPPPMVFIPPGQQDDRPVFIPPGQTPDANGWRTDTPPMFLNSQR